MKLTFSKINNSDIFDHDFSSLSENRGTLSFKHMHARGGIAVAYAPNGTGKSSLAKCLENKITSGNLSFVAKNEKGNVITPESDAFHIIHDQNFRNVIPGKETDYLIGKQIRREYELNDLISNDFDEAFKNSLVKLYKNEYKVSKVNDFLLSKLEKFKSEPYTTAYKYIRSIVNTREHGKSIKQDEFVTFIRNENNKLSLMTVDPEKKNWVISDCNNEKICKRIIELDYHKVIPNAQVIQIERDDVAIKVLKKYQSLDKCIICDNPNFDGKSLLTKKEQNRNQIYESLDKSTRELFDEIIENQSFGENDPFNIKYIVKQYIMNGDPADFLTLQSDLKAYINEICGEMINGLLHCFDGTHLFQNYDEYKDLVSKQPELDSEELLFIESIINESIGKNITIERDTESKNYKLKIGNKDLLNTSREQMELSSGEQNFISLAFELLLAKHSDKEYVVLDDPISSFDSVYKNKIAYCIIKFLEDKKQVVLTHNTDLVRLLDVQLNNCFNLYILNNTEKGDNGFIPVNANEKDLLINMHKLIQLFQNYKNSLVPYIQNEKQYLMSMIPFMRGYAHISLDRCHDYETLSEVMHGYESGEVDVMPIYSRLFGYDFSTTVLISVDDVLNLNCDDIITIDENRFPLLAMTLKQTLIYYHLRMKVEKVLVDSFNLEAHSMDTLNQIIQKAFRCNEDDPEFEKKREYRVFFTSRKTLLNEFNHFEGNMNLFQPAIDISPTSLEREINEINQKLFEVKEFANTLK